jgi:hypothetical protein
MSNKNSPTREEALEAAEREIDLVLTDPESKLSDGATRALCYIRRVLINSASDAAQPAPGPCPLGKGCQRDPDCTNRHQCWEPCGELGNSEAHVRVYRAPDAAPAGEPKPLLAGEIAAMAHRICTEYRHVERVKYGFAEMHLLDFGWAIEKEVLARIATPPGAAAPSAARAAGVPTRIERELEEFSLWLNEQGLQHVARELASRVIILPATPSALEAVPQPEPRFFVDHGMWHDRETGQHLYTEDQHTAALDNLADEAWSALEAVGVPRDGVRTLGESIRKLASSPAPAQEGSAPQEAMQGQPAIEELLQEVLALPFVNASEIDGEESDGTPRHWRNRRFVSLTKLERLLRARLSSGVAPSAQPTERAGAAADEREKRLIAREHPEARGLAAHERRSLGVVTRCRDCPHESYYSGGSYVCTKVQGADHIPDRNSIPGFCPLASSPAGATADQEILQAVWRELDEADGTGNAPGHCHSEPGIWDDDNMPDKAGKPCAWCLTWRKFTALVNEGEVNTRGNT